MPDYRMTNCHIHLFTLDHVPQNFPVPIVGFLRGQPGLINAIAWVLEKTFWKDQGGQVRRLGRMAAVGRKPTQEAVLRSVLHQYSTGTRFVVLPMDIAAGGYDAPEISLEQQHYDLHRLASKPQFRDLLVPFAKVHPARGQAAFDEFRKCIEEYGFRGLKLYPKLGHAPDDRLLMDKVYPYCVDNNLPVITHCSRGGVYARGWDSRRGEEMGAPLRYVPVLEAFPELRINLAHFGGSREWADYVAGIDPLDPAARRRNWVTCIRDMINSGKYPNLYTDISYTMFDFEENMPFLAVFLEKESLRRKVLFGSDYYMTKQEDLSERAVSMRLRHALGADVFREISEVNPTLWLTGGHG